MRAVCVLIPRVAVRVEQRDRPELRRVPVVIGGAPGERKVVLDCSPDALRRGVRPGMPLRQALALCREAAFVDPRPAVYAATFAAMLDAVERFSPRVQPAEPGCAFLDLDGTERLWPDERALALALQDAVRAACRLTPQVGIAGGMFAARCAAQPTPLPPLPQGMEERDALDDAQAGHPLPFRGGGRGERSATVVPQSATSAFLAGLSVEHLPVSGEMQRRLRLLGLRTLGELAALPVGAVQAQFGREGSRAWRLANGIDEERVLPRVQEEMPAERLDLPAPTADRGMLERAAEVLLRRLFRRPEVGNRLARRLTVRVTLEDGRAWQRTITFQDATADVAAALFALRTRLAALELPAAAEALTLTLHDLCGERGRQENMFSAKSRRTAEIEEAVRRLRADLGVAPILRLVEVEPWSRIPERHHALTEYDT